MEEEEGTRVVISLDEPVTISSSDKSSPRGGGGGKDEDLGIHRERLNSVQSSRMGLLVKILLLLPFLSTSEAAEAAEAAVLDNVSVLDRDSLSEIVNGIADEDWLLVFHGDLGHGFLYPSIRILSFATWLKGA